MNRVILKAGELDGYLTNNDIEYLKTLDSLYNKAIDIFPEIKNGKKDSTDNLCAIYSEIEAIIQEICIKNPGIHVYSFSSPKENHCEASRIIAKLRDVNTDTNEFIYYIQRAYELLYKLTWTNSVFCSDLPKNNFIVKTPVTYPVQNYAVHKIVNIDNITSNSVMCVMLRGALLPSMIISKEIEDYSSNGFITPFNLFRIYRNDKKEENNMEYILDLDKSFINFDSLNNKDLIFADPMNATGGSLVTIIKYLLSIGIKPRSIKFINIISALKGAFRVIRALENCDIYTLWMDSVLNKDAYIMPGLGDAGDRINGCDDELNPRDTIQLLAGYGNSITNLYRSQFREIENTVLGRNK